MTKTRDIDEWFYRYVLSIWGVPRCSRVIPKKFARPVHVAHQGKKERERRLRALKREGESNGSNDYEMP